MGSNDLRVHGLRRPAARQPGRSSAHSALLGNVRPVNPATGGSPGALPVAARRRARAIRRTRADGVLPVRAKDWTRPPAEDRALQRATRAARTTSPTRCRRYTELSYFQVKTDTRSTPTAMRARTGTTRRPTRSSRRSTSSCRSGHPDNPFTANNQGARLYYIDAALGGRDGELRDRTRSATCWASRARTPAGTGTSPACTSAATRRSRGRTSTATTGCCRALRARARTATTGSAPTPTSTTRRSTTGSRRTAS